MLVIPPSPARMFRGRKAPGAPLVLTSSGYEPDVPSIDLLFDREIDFSGIDLGAFTVADGAVAGCTWVGGGTIRLGTEWVQVLLTRTGDFSGPGPTLTVAAGNGIVAVDDGGTWPGAAGMPLEIP